VEEQEGSGDPSAAPTSVALRHQQRDLHELPDRIAVAHAGEGGEIVVEHALQRLRRHEFVLHEGPHEGPVVLELCYHAAAGVVDAREPRVSGVVDAVDVEARHGQIRGNRRVGVALHEGAVHAERREDHAVQRHVEKTVREALDDEAEQVVVGVGVVMPSAGPALGLQVLLAPDDGVPRRDRHRSGSELLEQRPEAIFEPRGLVQQMADGDLARVISAVQDV
jgi:hypothetical protein